MRTKSPYCKTLVIYKSHFTFPAREFVSLCYMHTSATRVRFHASGNQSRIICESCAAGADRSAGYFPHRHTGTSLHSSDVSYDTGNCTYQRPLPPQATQGCTDPYAVTRARVYDDIMLGIMPELKIKE